MKPLDIETVYAFVNENIVEFHRSKIRSLENVNLVQLLRRKNPYLFRAKHIVLAQDLVQGILDAHISSSEEELFGQFLEQLAIFIAGKTCDGIKSDRAGIDLEFNNRGVYWLVQIKSGVNWGNSSQVKRLEQDFNHAVAEVKAASDPLQDVKAVLGICYGKTRTSAWRGHLRVVGQNFWYFISENPTLYTDIIKPIGHEARAHNEAFLVQKAHLTNRLTQKLITDFCNDGVIDWEKIVQLNSGNLDLPAYFEQA